MTNVIQLVRVSSEDRVDTREIAKGLQIAHASAIKIVRKYRDDFGRLGLLDFKSESSGGRPVELALLNEDQCYLLLSYSRNTPRVRELKIALVQAFSEARRRGETESLSAWTQLQRLCIEDASSLVRASFGSRLMIDRKRALPDLRERRAELEARVQPQLALVESAA